MKYVEAGWLGRKVEARLLRLPRRDAGSDAIAGTINRIRFPCSPGRPLESARYLKQPFLRCSLPAAAGAERFTAVAQRLGDVSAQDTLLPVEVGKRACDSQRAWKPRAESAKASEA